MDMQHMSNEDALRQLAHVTPHAFTEFPQFVRMPRAVVARNENERLTVIFECVDDANDVSYAVEVPFGQDVPDNSQQGHERMIECAIEATKIANRNARAVWN